MNADNVKTKASPGLFMPADKATNTYEHFPTEYKKY